MNNEIRAHDLTILIMDHLYNPVPIAAKAVANGSTMASVDYFTEYVRIYDIVLEAFNRRFLAIA